ncbi:MULTISPECIES: serine hydrolase [unclassified Bradyrhizobium]|uniref:serine hydrolase domain-containing protein n=1 Tax=unclassified Bradyrhizobium TaxID=2631580 RepID=UPI001BAC9C9A|nr:MULTISPECIES: serine hydrolase [unclassified Bradyrhizobium]MBR1224417.1 serine hydrolase [Bradyrhizobium sp. AUGA SZCCT0176]MBR1297920.1 serine hydrolase [Bradyrhizobium sp. AUGA SZCCT0042]
MSVAAAQPTPTAAETDPQSLGWMQGFPPPPDKTIAFHNGSFRSFPELRWAWSNIRQLVPTVNVWRGAGPASVLPRADHDIGASKSVTMDGRPMTFERMLEETYADGIAVLHRGKLIYERYFGALKPHKPHIAMSVTKSFTGTLAGILIAEGKIDPQAPVTEYVPELKASAFGDARVREAMDMTTGLEYTEVYTDKNSGVFALRRANGMAPIEPGHEGATSIFDFLCTQRKQGEHGKAFAYKTVNSDVLAWIVRRASGMTLSDLLSERIWAPMGAEEDAHYHVDRIGTESGGGGLSTTLRDLARFGETIRNHGRFNGRQIVPSEVVEDIAHGGDPEKFKPAGYTTLPGASYRNQWWVTHNAHGAYMARGVHGQGIYIDPKAEMVIARYASHPAAGNAANDPVTLPAYMALAKDLMAGG